MSYKIYIWASTRENLSSGCANNKGADQPAHPRRLTSAFVIRFLDLNLLRCLASLMCHEETGLSLVLSETPKAGFVA